MLKLTDMQNHASIMAGEHFERRSDSNGLLRYREADRSLSKARETAKGLSACVALDYNVARKKPECKAEAWAEMGAEKNAIHISELAAKYSGIGKVIVLRIKDEIS